MGNNQKKFLDDAVSALKKDGHILVEDALGDSMSGMSYSVGQLLERFPGIKAGEPSEMAGVKVFDGGRTWVSTYKGLVVASKHADSYLGPKEIQDLPSLYDVLRTYAEKKA